MPRDHSNDDYRSYLFSPKPGKHGHFAHIPEIEGRVCVGQSVGDMFETNDRALSLLARLHGEYLEGGFVDDPEKAIEEFLESLGYGETWQTLIHMEELRKQNE